MYENSLAMKRCLYYNTGHMPELPEVETIRLGLEQYLVGHTIEDIEKRHPKILEGEVKDVIGAKITSVRRYGKGLVIDLDNDYSIAIHIKMTGQLIYFGPDRPKDAVLAVEKTGAELPNIHTHVIFKLDKDSMLYYNDIRRFGWIKILPTIGVSELPFFKGLGPELPIVASIADREVMTKERFRDVLRKSKGPIKPLLLDQKKIGGIGNIYANDGLFVAKIHPKRVANTLSEKEADAIFEAIVQVMKKGLSVGGASEWQYVNALGGAGEYQNFFQVYGKWGKPCAVCGTKIKKIVMGGRGTFYCPNCQPENDL
jgi:formamidopyrimidine-DNA glycosylase